MQIVNYVTQFRDLQKSEKKMIQVPFTPSILLVCKNSTKFTQVTKELNV